MVDWHPTVEMVQSLSHEDIRMLLSSPNLSDHVRQTLEEELENRPSMSRASTILSMFKSEYLHELAAHSESGKIRATAEQELNHRYDTKG